MAATLPLEVDLAESWPPARWSDVTVLLAVSGGADSVAMLQAMVRLRRCGPGRLVVGHVNHGLRGTASDGDEAFVVELCRGLQLPCEIERLALDRGSVQGGDGREAVARRGRYERLTAIASRCGARYLVTAHTADDQAETIVHHILRGTGLTGLAGMPRCRVLSPAVTLIRPLLGVRRTAIRDYLRSIEQPFRDDASNNDRRLTRNAIRHELLPHLQQRYNSQVVEALVRLGTLAGESQAVIDREVCRLVDQAMTADQDGAVTIVRQPFADQPRQLVREVLMAAWRNQEWPRQAMGFVQWETLASMLIDPPCPPRVRTLPDGIRVERLEDRLVLRPTEAT
jgi:tRNA(Ile)-lysidine synthase